METETINTTLCSAKCGGCTRKNKAGNEVNTDTQSHCPVMAKKLNKMVIGYAPGAYDLFHVGHLNLLKKAKQQCDYLIAGVVSDEMLLQNKGIAPVVPLNERLEIVRNVKYVDEAIAETLPDKVGTWEQLHFDILFKGDDWKGTEKGNQLEQALKEHNVEVVYFPYTLCTSSSILRKSLVKLNGITVTQKSDNNKLPFYKAASLLYLKPRFQNVLRPLTNKLAGAGVTANQVTILALLGSFLTSIALFGFHEHTAVFSLLPIWLFLRMGLSTIDGLLAIEHGQKSRLGGILNEGGDIISDIVLSAPFILMSSENQITILLLMALAVISELTGIAGEWFGGTRCQFGPFGKTDRAIAFSLVSLWLSISGSLPQGINYILITFFWLHIFTIANRAAYLFKIADFIQHIYPLKHLPHAKLIKQS